MIFDVVVDTLADELLEDALGTLGGRVVRDPDDPGEPFLTPDGYLVVRVRDVDAFAFAREMQRRVGALRVVGVYERKGQG